MNVLKLSLDDSMSMICSRAVDGVSAGAYTFDESMYKNTYPYVEKFYPQYLNYWRDEKIDNRVEKAFNLAQALIKKKFVKEPKTVENFIELVNTLADEL